MRSPRRLYSTDALVPVTTLCLSADPTSFADMLIQIAAGRLVPHRPPWFFHQKTSARITANPATFAQAFRRIGRRRVGAAAEARSEENTSATQSLMRISYAVF